MVRYLQVLVEMGRFGLPTFTVAQALPGVLGRNGWLALSELADLCGRIPGLITAPRSVIHFWWNMGEVTLLLLAAWGYSQTLVKKMSNFCLNAQQKELGNTIQNKKRLGFFKEEIKMAKITFIGAGSTVFAKNLLGDILSFP